MSTTFKSLTKDLVLSIPYAREKYLQKEFSKRSPSCKGLYKTFSDAAKDAPGDKLAGYDHRIISSFYRVNMDEFDPADYPVIFWLSRLLPETRFVFELGGSIGVGFYAYRKYLSYSPELRWMICEVPETVQAGEEIAREKKERQLTFTEKRRIEERPDLYTTFGALQYIEDSLADIILELPTRPPHLLLSRVPFTEGTPFITLQNNGCWFTPYKVDNRADFISSIESLGYELVDKWQMSRSNIFLLAPSEEIPGYHGMYFRLK